MNSFSSSPAHMISVCCFSSLWSQLQVLQSVIAIFCTHLTLIVAVKVRRKHVTDSNSDVTVSECGGGTKVWNKQASSTDHVWIWCSWDCPLLMYYFKYNQQDETLYNILDYCQCSACFRRFLRPSSGAQKLYTQHRVYVKLACCYR